MRGQLQVYSVIRFYFSHAQLDLSNSSTLIPNNDYGVILAQSRYWLPPSLSSYVAAKEKRKRKVGEEANAYGRWLAAKKEWKKKNGGVILI